MHKQSIRGTMATLLIALVLAAVVRPAAAQVSFSVGPHVSTLGFGVSGEVRIIPLVGVSAEYNFAPISSIERRGFDSSFIVDPTLGGAMIMVMLHPTGGKFAIGAGLLAGGLTGDASITLDPASSGYFTLGNGEYLASQVGSLLGDFEYGTTQPAFMLGWLGGGFNFAIGAAIATPSLDFSATGALKNDPVFLADLNQEESDIADDLKLVPVYPYIRLGWQFGF